MKPLPILGVACHLPDAESPEAFWRNLAGGHDSIREATFADWGVEPSSVVARPGEDTLDRAASSALASAGDLAFDPAGFCLPEADMTGLPRDFTWPLHVARQALEDAGLRADTANPDIGLILGHYGWAITGTTSAHVRPLHDRAVRRGFAAVDPALTKAVPGAGSNVDDLSFASNARTACLPEAIVPKLAQALGLGGPCYAIDAACASFLYGLKLAAYHIRSGAARQMIVVAANASDQLFLAYGLTAVQALARTGRSRPFDASSDGLTPGVGAVAMVVGATPETMRHPPHGVIRSIGLSSDGRGQHLTAPNPKGQLLACRRALEEGGIAAGSVEFVECHATGTPVGDRTELELLGKVYGTDGPPPPAGAVKSNVGHLMTAAGGVGLMKTLMAMRHAEIPPTIAIARPLPEALGLGQEVPVTALPWPRRGGTGAPLRAAVNAFGFGGTNAHLIVDSAGEAEAVASTTEAPFCPPVLAITGLAAQFGPWAMAGDMARAMREGREGFRPLPPARWRGQEGDAALMRDLGFADGRAPEGAYIDRLRFDPMHFRMPPKDVTHLNPQQLLMLDLGDRALRDAGIEPGGRVAVIVAMAIEQDIHLLGGRWSLEPRLRGLLDSTAAPEVVAMVKNAVRQPPDAGDFLAYVGNLMASRITALWDFSGPSFTISAGPCAVVQAIDLARSFLENGEADAVLVGAMDLSAGFENMAIRQAVSPGATGSGPGFGLDAASVGWRLGDGGGAVVLRRLDDTRDGEAPTYATIDGAALVHVGGTAAVATAAEKALREAGAEASAVSYLEVSGRGHRGLDAQEMSGLAAAYGAAPACSIAVGSAAAGLGDCGVAGGMAGLIRAALALSGASIPPLPGWSGPRNGMGWDGGPFHVPVGRTPLLARAPRAAVSVVQGDGTFGHLVLGQAPKPLPRDHASALALPFVLPVGAADATGLEGALQGLANDLRAGLSAAEAERAAVAAWPGPGKAVVACLVGDSEDALAEEAERLAPRVRAVLAEGRNWRSPRGSCLSGAPVGPDAKVAFVYSGMQNAYPGLGRDALALLPGVARDLAARFDDPAAACGHDLLFPRSLVPPTARDREAAAQRLETASRDVLRIGVMSSWVQTQLVTEITGLRPDLAFGHSLGEISMVFAAGVWTLGSDWLGRLDGMEPLLDRFAAGPGVAAYLVACDPARVRAAATAYPGIELPMSNSRRECVLRGAEADCVALIAELDAEYVRLDPGLALHGRLAKEAQAALAGAFAAPIAEAPTHTLLFTGGEVTSWSPESVGARVAEGLASALDFPALIESAYADGARIFVELGPGGACSRWIDECLSDRPHAAISTARRGTDDADALAQVLAMLVAHGYPVDLRRALARPAVETSSNFAVDVVLGGAPISEGIVTGLKGLDLRRAAPATVAANMPAEPPPAGGATQALAEIATTQSRGHLAWLRQRRALIDGLGGGSAAAPVLVSAVARPVTHKRPVFDEADVLEVAEGRLSNVFGPAFRPVDSYARRVRVPGQPFTAMSRVTEISGTRGRFDSGRIVTEYDIPSPAWFAVDGRATSQLALDAQGVLFLLAWLGVDLESRGLRRFRWLDARITMLGDLPLEGETLRFDITLDRAFRDADSLMLTFSMEATVNGRPLLRNEDCCVGFFTDAALAGGDGIRPHHRARRERALTPFAPLLPVPSRSLGPQDFLALAGGDLGILSPLHTGLANPALRLPPAALHMVDRITAIDAQGGHCGLGRIVAERRLDPDHWAIRAHFKDDCVFPGPCMLEGAVQILKIYALAIGLQTKVSGARFEPLTGHPYQLRFREQVIPRGQIFTYQVDIIGIGLGPEPWLMADVEFQEAGRAIGRIEGLGLRLACGIAAVQMASA
jgi:PfaB family protein